MVESSVKIGNSDVCKEAIIEGDVTIGNDCVVHPLAEIRATKGPIFIGNNNIIEEFVKIENLFEEQPMIIGDNNVFQIKMECRAKYIGCRNWLGVRSIVHEGSFIPDDCSVGACCVVQPKQTLEPFTCIYGQDNKIRISKVPNQSSEAKLDLLKKLLPSYHYLYGKNSG